LNFEFEGRPYFRPNPEEHRSAWCLQAAAAACTKSKRGQKRLRACASQQVYYFPPTAPATHTQLDPRTNPDPHVILQTTLWHGGRGRSAYSQSRRMNRRGGGPRASFSLTAHRAYAWGPARDRRCAHAQRNTDASPPGGARHGATARRTVRPVHGRRHEGASERALADHVTVHVSRPTHIYNRGSAADHHPLPSSRPLSLPLP
jgi:hypothetical protein